MRAFLVWVVAILAIPAQAAALGLPVEVPELPTARAPTDTPQAALDATPLGLDLPLPSERAGDPPARSPLTPPVAAAATATGALALLGLAVGLYSRLARADILSHERRKRMHALIQAEPGISPTDIAERLGLAWGATLHHLDKLVGAGAVLVEHDGGRRRCYLAGAIPRAERPAVGALHHATTRGIAAFLLERPGATQGEVAAALGLTASAASKQVTKLEGVGLLRRERSAHAVHLHPEPTLTKLLSPT